jgi:hypothetical protein
MMGAMAERIRQRLARRKNVEEKQMFGGGGFLLNGNLLVGIWKDSLCAVLHTCHHRTQVQAWLRLAGHEPVPAIYGPSGDVK